MLRSQLYVSKKKIEGVRTKKEEIGDFHQRIYTNSNIHTTNQARHFSQLIRLLVSLPVQNINILYPLDIIGVSPEVSVETLTRCPVKMSRTNQFSSGRSLSSYSIFLFFNIAFVGSVKSFFYFKYK